MLLLVRYVLFSLYFALIAVLGVVVCLFRPFNPNNNRLLARIFSYGGLKILGLKVNIENPERLVDLDPGVVVSNHQSNLDLFVLGCIVPPKTASIGKKSLKWVPFFGQLFWLAGNVLIDRKNAQESIGAMDDVSRAIHEDHRSIWVFAEGTRNKGRGLGRFKKGAFHIAIQAQCSITPVAAGTYSGRLKLNEWRSGEVTVSILPAVSAEGLEEKDVDDLLQKVHLQIANEIGRLDTLAPVPLDE